MCERAKCSMDRFASWSFKGLTFKSVLLYVRNAHILENERDTFDAALHGRTMEVKAEPLSEDARQRIAADPMQDFPNDVDYTMFTGEYLEPKMQSAQAYLERLPPNHVMTLVELENLWSPARVSAVRGVDPVAKRAAVSGKLWAVYVTMLQHAGSVDIDMLRKVISRDVDLLKLCPSTAEAEIYNQKLPADKQFNFRSEIVEVPAAHVEKLMREGSLSRILKAVAGIQLPALSGAAHV